MISKVGVGPAIRYRPTNLSLLPLLLGWDDRNACPLWSELLRQLNDRVGRSAAWLLLTHCGLCQCPVASNPAEPSQVTWLLDALSCRNDVGRAAMMGVSDEINESDSRG